MPAINILSQKQIDSFQQSDARINIFEGPVRAGKSFIALLRWLEFCRSGPPGPLILCGRTDKTIKRNIIDPLQNLVGSAVQYRIGRGEVQLYNRVMAVVGANDERSVAKIQGSEFAGALVDELSLMPESFIKMLLSRLSIPNAKLFGSTNPDSPYHWLKTDFIDRRDVLDCKVFSYTIDDNPSLDEEYKKQLKLEYRGLWYKRYIEGLWVVAEGAVYDFFNESEHVINRPPGPATKYFVGVDYGTQNPCVFLLIGYNPGLFPNIWCEKEYYHDSKAKMRQKSDYEYTQDFIKFLDGITPEAIFIDPSASSLKVELRRNGIQNIRDAVNDVLPGIRFQGQLLSNGTYKICSQCTETIKEYSNYVWDEKASRTGDERPVKKFDHCITGDSLLLTINGYCKICDLINTSGKITSLKDNKATFCKYINVRKTQTNVDVFEIELECGTKLKATPEHRFLTQNGWKELRSLSITDLCMCTKERGQKQLRLSVNIVRRLLRRLLQNQRNVAQSPAEENLIFKKIKSIKYVGKEDVFCLDVPETQNFIANGMVVHNCKDAERYLLFTNFFGKNLSAGMSESDAEKMEREYRFRY